MTTSTTMSPVPGPAVPDWKTPPAGAALVEARALPSALTHTRDTLVRLLSNEGRLSCGAIARLRWEMFVTHSSVQNDVHCRTESREGRERRLSDSAERLLVTLHRQERAAGFGGAADFVVRFRGGSADLVSRANSVRRILTRPAAGPNPA